MSEADARLHANLVPPKNRCHMAMCGRIHHTVPLGPEHVQAFFKLSAPANMAGLDFQNDATTVKFVIPEAPVLKDHACRSLVGWPDLCSPQVP